MKITRLSKNNVTQSKKSWITPRAFKELLKLNKNMKKGYYKKDGEYFSCTILGETDAYYVINENGFKPSDMHKDYLIMIDSTGEKIEVSCQDLYVTKD